MLDIIEPIAWQDKPVPPRRWLVDGLIPQGAVTLLSGDGGIGKSLLVQQLGTACAIGKAWLGINTLACKTFLIFCEDDRHELHRRQADINAHYGKQFGDLENMRMLSRVGRENLLYTIEFKNDRGKVTALYDAVRDAARNFGAQLVVIDTAADTFGGNENFRIQVRQFVNELRRIALDTDGAIVLTSHPSVAGIATNTGLSGSTAWGNSVRARLFLTRPPRTVGREDEEPADLNVRVLRGMKSNYGRTGDAIKLRWVNGVFVAEGQPTGLDRMVADAKADRLFLELLGATYQRGEWVSSAPNVRNFAPRRFAEHPQADGLGKKAFQAAMERMLHAGRIKAETYGRPSEPRFRLALQ
jgi:RecA-family ATPase